MFLGKFSEHFADQDLQAIVSENILAFLVQNTDGQKPSTKRLKYTLLKSFFNFVCDNINNEMSNPADTPILRRTFRMPTGQQWTILDKDVVDEIIFRTSNIRNRLLLEMMARGGMRVGEVLNLKAKDVNDRRLLIETSKSGKESEVVFIPKKVAERLKDYVRSKSIGPDQHIFPIEYTGARAIVKKAGNIVGIDLNPHDLRRHAATYASRSGAPIEIVSKVILRHANLSTTQRYLGKVSDTEALRWIENIYT